MRGFITDRSQRNIDRLNALEAKGWANMTDAERAEWSGNPLSAADSVNLLPDNNYISHGAELVFRNESIIATATEAVDYCRAAIVVGNAEDFQGKTVTLSIGSMTPLGGGVPFLSLCWYGGGEEFEYAGIEISEPGSITETLLENTQNMPYLALFVHASTDANAEIGASVMYGSVMLELGNVAHGYVPYAEIIPTEATKGAYNYSDLNRVEKAVAEAAVLLGLELETKTDWNAWDIPTERDVTRYIENIRAIREASQNKRNIPIVPSGLRNLNYTTANNIEKTLESAYLSAESLWRGGELYCGEV